MPVRDTFWNIPYWAEIAQFILGLWLLVSFLMEYSGISDICGRGGLATARFMFKDGLKTMGLKNRSAVMDLGELVYEAL